MFRASVLATLLASYAAADDFVHYPDKLCLADCVGSGSSEVCTFNFKMNLFASELGYYTVDNCDGIMPVLGMKKNVQYRFSQEDKSNYYHPLGFAYYADGAHDDVDELEPGITPDGSVSLCGDDNSCPAPMYLNSGNYLGVYSNIDEITAATGDEDFGLDVYEPQFFANPVDWLGAGPYEVALKFDVVDFTKDIVYFCHIHQYMSGRIKWVDETGAAYTTANEPEIPYEYEVASAYDQSCGTYNLDAFQLPNAECPSEFVCNKGGTVGAFAGCIDSMNCAMTAGMTTGATSDSAAALFVHQMIPHHQNAVNMAKALLNSGELVCDDLSSDETAGCLLEQISLEIITQQNHQIQSMRAALEELGYIGEDDCKVAVSSTGPFSIVSGKQFDDMDYCVVPSATSARVIIEACTGGNDQTWMINANGGLESTADGKCMSSKGKNVKMVGCDGVSVADVTLSLDGSSIAMKQKANIKFVSIGGIVDDETVLKLKPSKDSPGQSWSFNHMKAAATATPTLPPVKIDDD